MINKNRLIKLTQKVIQFDSQNPPGNELNLGKFIERDMKSLGLSVRTYSFAKNRPNIVATLKGSWPRKRAAKEAVLITPHYDTVPFGSGWSYDPLGAKIDKGKIFGRGASDDKSDLACCMEVMRSLTEDGVKLKRDVIMAATADEETGSHYGIIPLLDKKILKPRVAVVTDSDENDVIVAQKGLLHMRVQIFGKKAHGAYNWRGVSAIEQAAKVIEKLKSYKFRYKKHKRLHGPSINIGTIQGGDKVNMVADLCEFSVDCRFMPTQKAKDVLNKIKKIIGSVTKNFKVIVDDLQHPYEIDPNHKLVKTYVASSRKMKFKPILKGSEGATVITFFQKHKIPAFATGYGSHKTAHTTDEYVHVKFLQKGAKVLERFLKDYDAND